MEDYTKFKLKGTSELQALLQDKDRVFVVACNKCFKEFSLADEPECATFERFATEQGTTVLGSLRLDFLCNKTLTEKALLAAYPPDVENLMVISCGLGIQTITACAEAHNLPVLVSAASDSISFEGHHGMALTKRLCDACGQCFLNLTGGICPIVDCSKSLVNGQCGGAKNGKCEVDKFKDCAWEKIYQRLQAQGRADELHSQHVQLRDYSKLDFKFINEHVQQIRDKRFEGYYGGLHPAQRKQLSESKPLMPFPSPQSVVIPLSQHTGAPAEPLVKAGDRVLVGEKIGEATAYVSSPVHASISGTVAAVEPRKHPTTGKDVLSVVIVSDGKNKLHESIKPYGSLEGLTADDILGLVREKGIVGMGGAAFPTAVKLKSPKPIDTVLLNGCECEPLLTADHQVMLTYADDVIFGLKALLKATHAARGIIMIEDNKADVIELMESKTTDIPGIEVMGVKTKYPQGAEKMLIKRATGRSVPSGGLPLDVGVIVSNVSTAKALSDAIQKGMPLIERAVTVSGERIAHPGNYLVRIGTSVADLVAHCGGVSGTGATFKIGGPMMGVPISDLDVPVIKGTNGIIALDPIGSESSECITCGRCVDVCPMELLPLYYPKLVEAGDWQGLKDKNVNDCMECGCCDFICSARIALTQAAKTGKSMVAEMEKKPC